MNRTIEIALKLLRRKVYPLFGSTPNLPELSYISSKETATNLICSFLSSDKPCMIARFGAFELATTVNYLGVKTTKHSVLKYIKGQGHEWWWNTSLVNAMQTNAGFFPVDNIHLCMYGDLMLKDVAELDILGSWQKEEYFLQEYIHNCQKVRLRFLEPDFFATDASKEWTQTLTGKRVLVIHPFVETIKKQYEKRNKLFQDPNFLPDFQLLTIKAVQSIGGSSDFASWFEALDYMKSKMDELDYDIAIMGCGAYGFNLAAHAKKTGHKAIHLGGATQLLFGIRGKRWEDREDYKNLFNDNWVRPGYSERPSNAEKVEGGCYW